jgi:Holliday junction resolvase-like predicted endonuclease
MTPESSIRYHKRRKLIGTVRALLRTHGRAGLTPRIDVIAIIWPKDAKKPMTVRHHRGVIPLAAW